MRGQQIKTLLCLLSGLAFGVLAARATTPPDPAHAVPAPKIGEAGIVSIVPPSSIPPVTNPVFISCLEAEALMYDHEPVLGVVDPATGQAKAYSLWYLDRHEVVNDRLGGEPIAVTW